MKKKVSIVGFSEIWFAVLWITFSIMLLSLYLLLSIHLKSTLVHKSNRENIRRIEHLLVQDDQEGITIEEPYTLDKGYFIVLLDQDNKVIAGSCPAEFRDYDFALKKEETLEIDGKKYHLDFKRIPHKEIRKIYVLCAIADIRAAATMLDEIRTNIIVFFYGVHEPDDIGHFRKGFLLLFLGEVELRQPADVVKCRYIHTLSSFLK